MTFCWMGIDPGISGAVAFLFPSHPDRVTAEDVPVVSGQISGALLFDRVKQIKPDAAIIELVSARPGQGVSSMFKFGRAFGTVIGVVQAAGVPLHFVTPWKWKRHFALSADKDAAREYAIRMFPQTASHFARKCDHGRAEAALMALYAAQTIQTQQVAA